MSEDSRDLDAVDVTKIKVDHGKTIGIRAYPPKEDPYYHKHAALVAEFEREEAVWASLKKAPVEDRVTPQAAPAKTLVAAVSTAPIHTPVHTPPQARSYFGGVVSTIFNRATFGYFSSDES